MKRKLTKGDFHDHEYHQFLILIKFSHERKKDETVSRAQLQYAKVTNYYIRPCILHFITNPYHSIVFKDGRKWFGFWIDRKTQ